MGIYDTQTEGGVQRVEVCSVRRDMAARTGKILVYCYEYEYTPVYTRKHICQETARSPLSTQQSCLNSTWLGPNYTAHQVPVDLYGTPALYPPQRVFALAWHV